MNLAYIPSPTFSKFEIGPFTIHMYAICILIVFTLDFNLKCLGMYV